MKNSVNIKSRISILLYQLDGSEPQINPDERRWFRKWFSLKLAWG
jgi:hypothetical protein